MAHILILILFPLVLSETLLLHEKPSTNENNHIKHLNIFGVPFIESSRKLLKRQAEDFGPPDDSGSQGPVDGGNSGNKTGGNDKPRGRRGGGRRRPHRPGNRTHHGCPMMGRPQNKPPTEDTKKLLLVGHMEYHDTNNPIKDLESNKLKNYRGNGRRPHKRDSAGCKDGGGPGDSESSTPAPSSEE